MAGSLCRKRPRRCHQPSLVLAALLATVSCEAEDEPQPMPLADAVGQMLLIGSRGTELDSRTASLPRELSPGGVILFDYDVPSEGAVSRNIESTEKPRSLIDSLQSHTTIQPLVAVAAFSVNRLKSEFGFRVEVPSLRG